MKFIRSSYELHMEFKWISHEFHMKLNQIYSQEFTCSSYGLHIEELMKLVCYTHVIQTRWHDLNFIWTSKELHDKYTRSSYVLHMNMVSDILVRYFIWMSLQVHRSNDCTEWCQIRFIRRIKGQRYANLLLLRHKLSQCWLNFINAMWRHKRISCP